MDGIRLHPKHGLNPTIPRCAWCGEDKNEVALLGSKYKGEAPMHMVIDDVPCEKCQAQMDKGITLFEAAMGIDGKPHRTGRFVVITEDAARRVFTEPMLTDVLRVRSAHVDPEAWTLLGLGRE